MAETPKAPKIPRAPLRPAAEARVFRQFLDGVDQGWIHRASFEARHPRFSFTLAKLLASAADLDFLAGLLEKAAQEPSAGLSPTEQSLAELAAAVAPRLAALARELEQEAVRRVPEEEASPPTGSAGRSG